MTRIRPLLRQVAYRSGGLGLMRHRLRSALTVVMFHRVIDPADPDFADADPGNTVSARFFEESLEFFTDHYTVVGLADLFAAANGTRVLPNHPLLISFDDGWADNLRYAAPLLRSRGLPAVIFIAAEPILSPDASWWQQQVFDAARRGALDISLAVVPGRGTPRDALDYVCRLAGIEESERANILASIPARAPASRMMLAPEEVSSLAKFGIAVGIHGFHHLPLTEVADLYFELRQARSAVGALSGDEVGACALACPHGRYDQRVLAISREVGIRLIFTSDPILNPTRNGRISETQPLGRISMEAPHLVDGFGRLDPSAAASWLWRRPIAAAQAPRSLG